MLYSDDLEIPDEPMQPAEVSQRWKAGRALYRPASEVINPLDYRRAAFTQSRGINTLDSHLTV